MAITKECALHRVCVQHALKRINCSVRYGKPWRGYHSTRPAKRESRNQMQGNDCKTMRNQNKCVQYTIYCTWCAFINRTSKVKIFGITSHLPNPNEPKLGPLGFNFVYNLFVLFMSVSTNRRFPWFHGSRTFHCFPAVLIRALRG